MLNVDNLLSICEIAAALAGFAAIVTILDKGKNLESWARLQSVLLICILVIAAALVPVLLIEYQLTSSSVFRFSAIAFLALIWLTILTVNNIAKKAGGDIWRNVGGKYSNLVMWTAEVFIQFPLLFCVFGLFDSYHSAFYLTALILNLFQAAQFFYMLAIHPRIED